jgi:tRNA(fMet)-specific endonuclease VapC
MAMKKVLLDTNAYSKLLTGDEQIFDILGKAEVVFLPVVVIGELLAGFKGGTRESKNRKFLESFLKKPTVEIINITTETAEIYSELYNQLKKAGTPVPMNDIWIAASAIESGSVIVSFDRHFSKIAGVRLWNNVLN